jgi:hypothetical protein
MIEKIIEKCCEYLPADVTFFEKDGLCTRDSDACKYSVKKRDSYFCHKHTKIFFNEYNRMKNNINK